MSEKWKPSTHEKSAAFQIRDLMKNESKRSFTLSELKSEVRMSDRVVRNILHWLEDEQLEPIYATSDRKGYRYGKDEDAAEMLHARSERISRAVETLKGNRGIERKLRELGVPFDEVKITQGNFKF